MKNIIICKKSSIGGTGSVINHISNRINAEIILVNIINIKYLLKISNKNRYIAIQPTAVFSLLLINLFNRKLEVFYIFDAHPFGFERNIKSLLIKPFFYWFSAIISWLLINKNKLIVPDGPLKNIFPFNQFTQCSWDDFVEEKFKNGYSSDANFSFLYYGTVSKEKNFNVFLDFSQKNSKYKFKIVGLMKNKYLISNYLGIYDGANINCNQDVLCWCSKYESYGLSFREYIKSGGSVVFLRKFHPCDRIQNAIYLDVVQDGQTFDFIFDLLKIFRQEIIPSPKISFFKAIGLPNV